MIEIYSPKINKRGGKIRCLGVIQKLISGVDAYFEPKCTIVCIKILKIPQIDVECVVKFTRVKYSVSGKQQNTLPCDRGCESGYSAGKLAHY